MDTEIRKLVGRRIRSVRRVRRVSQKQLANILDVHFSTISHWESGNYIPTLENLIKTCIFLNIRLDYIIGFQKDPEALPNWHEGTRKHVEF